MSLYRSPLGSSGGATGGSHLTSVPMSIEEEDAIATPNGTHSKGSHVDGRLGRDYSALNAASNSLNNMSSASNAPRSPSKAAPPHATTPMLAASSRMQAIKRTGSLGAHDFLARLHQVHGERERRHGDEANDGGFSCAVCGVRHYRERDSAAIAAGSPQPKPALASRELPLLIEPFAASTERLVPIDQMAIANAGIPMPMSMSFSLAAYNLSPRCGSPVNAGPMGGGAFPGLNSPNSCRSFDSAVAIGGEPSPVHVVARGAQNSVLAGSGAFTPSRLKSPVSLQVPIASSYAGVACAQLSSSLGSYLLEQETLYRRSMESVRVEHSEASVRAVDVSRLCRSYENTPSPMFPRTDHHVRNIISNSNEPTAYMRSSAENSISQNPAARNQLLLQYMERDREETAAAILKLSASAAAVSSSRRPHDMCVSPEMQSQQQRPLRRALSLLTRSGIGVVGSGGSRVGDELSGAHPPRNVASMRRRQSWLRSMSAAKCSIPHEHEQEPEHEHKHEHEDQAQEQTADEKTRGRQRGVSSADGAADDRCDRHAARDVEERLGPRCSKEADSGVSVALSGEDRDRRGAPLTHCRKTQASAFVGVVYAVSRVCLSIRCSFSEYTFSKRVESC